MDTRNLNIIFSNVFKHLTQADVAIAAQVSKSWQEYGICENFRRSTYFYVLDNVLIDFGLQWNFQNKHEEVNFKVVSSLGVFSSYVNNDENVTRGIQCKNSELDRSFMVNLKSNFNMKPLRGRKSFFFFTFPKEDLADVTILSFVNYRIKTQVPFRLLFFMEDELKQSTKFSFHQLSFFQEKNLMSCILIIFCQNTYYKKLLKLFESLHQWYECNKMAIWIAVVDELSTCRYDSDNHYCKIDTEFVFIFLNNPSIITNVHFLCNECNNPKKIKAELESFRKKLKLSLSSMALMHVPYIRLKKLFELDVFIFREVFPDVTLFPIYGTTSSYGSCFYDFQKAVLWPVLEDQGNQTSILIISRK